MKGRHVVQYINLSQLCLQQTGQCNERETYDCKKIVCIHVLLNLKCAYYITNHLTLQENQLKAGTLSVPW